MSSLGRCAVPAGAGEPEEDDPEDAAHGEGISARRDAYVAFGDMHVVLQLHDAGSTPATSAYLSLVKEIVPQDFRGREAELTELTEFSTRPGPGGYLWWRAPAWSGKSALLARFATSPPEGVRVVSFFVGRYPGHDNWEKFSEIVMKQLAAMLGKPAPSATDNVEFRGLLDEAAEECRQQGEILVLLVDGLDEDREAGQRSSIAAHLPVDLPVALRIVVSSRPHPSVLKGVRHSHPLHIPSIVRELSKFEGAQELQDEAEEEMNRLLQSGGFGLDVVGFLVAADGDLTSRDLARLITQNGRRVSTRDVEEFFRTVRGRTFLCVRSLGWTESDAAPQVYLFGHVELKRAAVSSLDIDEVARYRDQIHEWARSFHDTHWPDETPEYLFRRYFSMLKDTGDIPRMVECAMDRERHARMAELVGSDSPAFAEVEAARNIVHAQPAPPDLQCMALLAIRRELLRRRVGQIPVSLPAAWAAAGCLVRADHMLSSIMDARENVRALCELVAALARKGHHDLASAKAQQLVIRVEAVLRKDPAIEIMLCDAAGILTKAGFEAEAEAIARMLPTEHFSLRALGAILWQHALSGRDDRAEELAKEITIRATAPGGATASNPRTSHQTELPINHWQACQTLACLSKVLTDAGFPALAETVRGHQDRELRRTGIAHLPASAGWNLEPGTYYELRERVLGELGGLMRKALGASEAGDAAMLEQCRLARAAAHAGNVDAAKASAARISDPVWKARCLAETAMVTADAGSPLAARDLALSAWTAARGTTNRSTVVSMIADIAEAAAAAGRTRHVRIVTRLAMQVMPHPQDLADRGSVARVLAASGQFSDAFRCILPPLGGNPRNQGLAVTHIIQQMANHGEFSLALNLTGTIAGPLNELTMSRVAQAAARHGRPDIAERLLDDLTEPEHMASVLAALACSYADRSQQETAKELVQKAEREVVRISADKWNAAHPWPHIAKAWISVGEPDRAEQAARTCESIAQACPYPEQKASMTVDTVEALAIAGFPDEAESLARSIGNASYRGSALAALVSHVPQGNAAILVADALHLRGWQDLVYGALAIIAPNILVAAAEECCAVLV